MSVPASPFDTEEKETNDLGLMKKIKEFEFECDIFECDRIFEVVFGLL